MDNFYDKKLQLYQNYQRVCEYLNSLGLNKKEYIDDLKIDFLSTVKIKPKPFWYDENNLDYYRKLLGYENTNYFITPYYDKFIVIKYCENEKPKLFIE
jgi:hypothetical protein